MAFKIHPYANFIPPMGAEEYEALKADILQNGQRVPIIINNFKDGEILDGWHRYRACQELDRVPLTAEWDGTGSPLKFIISMNLHRRHLTESQRAKIAVDMHKTGKSAGTQTAEESSQKSGITLVEAAEAMGVGERTVRDAKFVLEQGTPAEIDAVQKGEAAVSTLAREIHSGKPAKERAASRKKKEKPANKVTTAPKTAEAPPPPLPAKKSTRELEIIAQVKEAVSALSFMPTDAAMVADIVRASDHKQYVEERLYKGFEWLQAFLDAWTTAHAEELAARARS
jgi:hypothetical protein